MGRVMGLGRGYGLIWEEVQRHLFGKSARRVVMVVSTGGRTHLGARDATIGASVAAVFGAAGRCPGSRGSLYASAAKITAPGEGAQSGTRVAGVSRVASGLPAAFARPHRLVLVVVPAVVPLVPANQADQSSLH
jgi:hypothetical protein